MLIAKCFACSFQIDQTSLELSREFLIKGIEEKFVKAYYEFMVDNAVLFGADKEQAEKEFLDVLDLEIKLANVCWNFPIKTYKKQKKNSKISNFNFTDFVAKRKTS